MRASDPDEALVSDGEVRYALNEHFRDTLVPITGGLAAIFVLFTVGNYATMPDPIGFATAAINLGLSMFFLLLHLGLRVWGLPPNAAPMVGTLIALLVLADALIPLYWMQQPVLTTYLLLINLGAAMFFLHWVSLITVVAAADVAWYVAFLRAGYSFDWAIFGLSLVTATILAAVAHSVRMRIHSSYVRLHAADGIRKRELELAADVASQSERRFRSLVEASSEGILVVDDGRIIDHNPAFASLFGWPAEEVAGRTLSEFLTSESLVRLEHVRFAGTTTPLEAMGVRRDGEHMTVQVSVRLAPFQGRFVRLLAIRDLPSMGSPVVQEPRPVLRARRR